MSDLQDQAGGPRPMIVNGKACPVPAGGTLLEVLAAVGLGGRPVAIEVNGDVVPRSRFAECSLTGGERIEIVTFVGGG